MKCKVYVFSSNYSHFLFYQRRQNKLHEQNSNRLHGFGANNFANKKNAFDKFPENCKNKYCHHLVNCTILKYVI